MLVAVPEFAGRVAPTFDFCRHLTLWRVHALGTSYAGERWFTKKGTNYRLSVLLSNRVDVLLCGAIGKDVDRFLRYKGIQVVSRLTGSIPEIISEFTRNSIFPNGRNTWHAGFSHPSTLQEEVLDDQVGFNPRRPTVIQAGNDISEAQKLQFRRKKNPAATKQPQVRDQSLRMRGLLRRNPAGKRSQG